MHKEYVIQTVLLIMYNNVDACGFSSRAKIMGEDLTNHFPTVLFDSHGKCESV